MTQPDTEPGYPRPVRVQPMGDQQTNTLVVVNQPAPVVLQQGMRDWSSGLCRCCQDCHSCKWSVHRLTREPTRSKVCCFPFKLYWDLLFDKCPLVTYSNQSELGKSESRLCIAAFSHAWFMAFFGLVVIGLAPFFGKYLYLLFFFPCPFSPVAPCRQVSLMSRNAG